MKISTSLAARLEFLSRVTTKECQHLLDTDRRLFANPFTIEEAQKVEADPILAERLDAFVSRFLKFTPLPILPGIDAELRDMLMRFPALVLALVFGSVAQGRQRVWSVDQPPFV